MSSDPGTLHLPWHRAQWARMARLRALGRVPHALLLSGPLGLGKSVFARRLSNALVCTVPSDDGDACGECVACRQSGAGSHPDQSWVTPDEPGKMIKIDAIRELTAKSVLAAQEGGYRVVVIDPADAMNRASANALLKTLEEPASRTVLILVSSHPDRLPATIRSRCHVVSFAVPNPAEIDAWLRQAFPDARAQDWLALAGGVPLRALQARDEDWLDGDRQLITDLNQLKKRKINPIQVVENWSSRPLPVLLEGLKRCLNDLVKICQLPACERVYHAADLADLHSLAEGIDFRDLHKLNDEVTRFGRDLRNNLNAQMMLEFLVNRWLQLTRPGGH